MVCFVYLLFGCEHDMSKFNFSLSPVPKCTYTKLCFGQSFNRQLEGKNDILTINTIFNVDKLNVQIYLVLVNRFILHSSIRLILLCVIVLIIKITSVTPIVLFKYPNFYCALVDSK